METKTEKKVLYFDESEYKWAVQGLQGMKETVQELIDVWNGQELLSKQEFTDSDLKQMTQRGSRYIKEKLDEQIRAGFEKAAPGLASQISIPEAKITGCDIDWLDRTCTHLRSTPPGYRSDRINFSQISIVKGRPTITDEMLASLKQTFTVYDDSPELKQFFELGLVAESTLTAIQELIDNRHKQREQTSGFRIPNLVKMFEAPGAVTADGKPKRGLFYPDKGKWNFNAAKIKR